jgi:hypothetical protein
MVSSILIIVSSLVLLVYWFRYTCILILNTKATKDYSLDVAARNNLSFPQVTASLREGAELDPLRLSLEREYRLLTYLLRHTTGAQIAGLTIEQRMLLIDFKLMRLWYALMRPLAARQARAALEEMSRVLGHLANAMGERVATRA